MPNRFIPLVAAFAALSLHAEEAPKPVPKPISSAFASTTATCRIEANGKAGTVVWPYTNHWEAPLVLERIDTSCGCLSSDTKPASVDEVLSVEPGGSGEITATFTPGNKRGKIRKSLHIKFVGHDKAVELVAEVFVPSPVEVSAHELTWTPKTADATKTIDITTGTDQSFTITGLLGVPERLYTIRQETLKPDRHYRLHITPTGEQAQGIQTLQVRTSSPDPRDQVIAVFLRSTNEEVPARTANTKP